MIERIARSYTGQDPQPCLLMRGLSLGHDAHSRLCHQCQPAFESHVIENRPHIVRVLAPLLHHARTFLSEDDTRLGVSTRLWSLLQGHSLIVSSLSFIPPQLSHPQVQSSRPHPTSFPHRPRVACLCFKSRFRYTNQPCADK
jgi:hypothetical protein